MYDYESVKSIVMVLSSITLPDPPTLRVVDVDVLMYGLGKANEKLLPQKVILSNGNGLEFIMNYMQNNSINNDEALPGGWGYLTICSLVPGP